MYSDDESYDDATSGLFENDWKIAIHTYDPDESGRCTSGWYNQRGQWVKCGSTQRSSILHDDPEAEFRSMHDHGGRDCMCFEDEDGPSYWAALEAYVESH